MFVNRKKWWNERQCIKATHKFHWNNWRKISSKQKSSYLCTRLIKKMWRFWKNYVNNKMEANMPTFLKSYCTLSTNEVDDFQDLSFGSGIQSWLHIKTMRPARPDILWQWRNMWGSILFVLQIAENRICLCKSKGWIKKSSRSRDTLLYFGFSYPKVG